MSDQDNVQTAIADMRQANSEMGKFLAEMDQRLLDIDVQYAKMLVKEEIDTLTLAKGILTSK
jgi:hypothetical protein